MLEISIHGLDAIQAKLQSIHDKTGNLRPALLEIGEVVAESTKQRFVTATDPDGNKWALNTPATLLAEDKFGNLRKVGDTPLTNHGDLARSIAYKLVDGNKGVEIGTNAVQAAMMQFGGTKAEFPHLWGDIPARPFIGISESESTHILDLLESYLL